MYLTFTIRNKYGIELEEIAKKEWKHTPSYAFLHIRMKAFMRRLVYKLNTKFLIAQLSDDEIGLKYIRPNKTLFYDLIIKINK